MLARNVPNEDCVRRAAASEPIAIKPMTPSTKAGRVHVDVAEWHGSVAVVKEPKMSQTPLVCFFHPHKLTFEKVTAFDRLDDRWPAVLVGGTKSSRGIGIKIPPVWCEGE